MIMKKTNSGENTFLYTYTLNSLFKPCFKPFLVMKFKDA